MGNGGKPHPEAARDATELAAALRGLKEWSGLTYRQLEERAAGRGEVLPRSTLAAVLRGNTAPRPEVLAAFVRSCGDGERLALWLRVWADIHEQQRSSVAGASERRKTSWGGKRRRLVLLAAVLVGGLGAAGVRMTVISDGSAESGNGGFSSTDAEQRPALPSGWVRIRTTHAPGLCLTDGRVLDRRYTPLVAVQRPCDDVAPQGTTLEPVGGDQYRIKWHHPDYGKGCLRALTEGPGAGLLEPMDDCELGSHFYVEPSEPYGSGRYVLRMAGEGCVGIKGSATSEGSEAVMQRCVGKGGQVFLIERAP